jgi:MFS family permease
MLAVAMLLTMTTWFSASAVIPQLKQDWTLSSTTSAWLTIAVQVGFVIGALVSAVANLSDVMPARALLAIAALGAAGANALLVVSSGAALGIPARLATGILLAGVYPPGMKVIATWYRDARGRALGILVGALTLGSAVPHLVNSVGGLPWRTVVLTTSALTIAGAGIVWFLVSDGPYPFPRAPFDPRQAGRVLRDPAVRLASLGYFGHMWELYAMWAWFLVFFRESLAASGRGDLAVASFATFAVIGSGAAGSFAAGIMGDRWGRSRTTILAMAVSGSCALTIGWLFGANPWLVFGVGIVWGVTVVADSAQFSTVVTEVGDPSYIGTALTLQLALGFTLTVATIWLVPIIRVAVGWGPAFSVLAVGPVLGIASMAKLQRSPQAFLIAGGRG